MSMACAWRRMCAVAASATITAMPPLLPAHHAFAGYDQKKLKVFTGAVISLHPDANHLVIIFAPLNDQHSNVQRDAGGNPLQWQVEFAQGAAMAAQEGVTADAFHPGTVFSVALHPMRNGDRKGSREGPVFRCPGRNVPRPGEHCDAVEGSTRMGTGELPQPMD